MMSKKMIFAYAAGKINKEDGMYYMAAKDRRNKEMVGVFRYPFRWLAAHEGNAVIFDLITKAEYETYVAFGIEEITIPEIAKLGAIVDD
jgi:hypothetical protein